MSRPLALSLDFGGTKGEAALVDDHGTVVPGTRHRQPTGPHRTSEQLATSVRTAVGTTHAALPTGASLAGVGVGAAGQLDDTIGTVSPLNLPAWRGYPLGELIAQIVPAVPITLRIDGLCIALAEHWVGAGGGGRKHAGMFPFNAGAGGERGVIWARWRAGAWMTRAPVAATAAWKPWHPDPRPSPGHARGDSPATPAKISVAPMPRATPLLLPRSNGRVEPLVAPSPRQQTCLILTSRRSAAGFRASPPRCSSTPATLMRNAQRLRFHSGYKLCPPLSPTKGPSSVLPHSYTGQMRSVSARPHHSRLR